MTARHRSLRAAVMAAALAAVPAGAFANDEVLRRLSLDVADKTVRLAAVEKECAAQATRPPPAELSTSTMTQLGLARGPFIQAIGYLAQRNSYACSYQALVDLLYATTVSERVQRDYGKEPDQARSLLSDLVQPSTRYFEMAADFARLPDATRQALEQRVGTEPFDPFPLLSTLPEQP